MASESKLLSVAFWETMDMDYDDCPRDVQDQMDGLQAAYDDWERAEDTKDAERLFEDLRRRDRLLKEALVGLWSQNGRAQDSVSENHDGEVVDVHYQEKMAGHCSAASAAL